MKQYIVSTEAQEQEALFAWRDYNLGVMPELGMLFHIGNEGNRGGRFGAIDGARNKRMGVSAGVPDLFLPVARGKYHGLFIEMKRRKGGRLSGDQKAWIEALNRAGYLAMVCNGAEAAEEALKGYLTIEKVKDGHNETQMDD